MCGFACLLHPSLFLSLPPSLCPFSGCLYARMHERFVSVSYSVEYLQSAAPARAAADPQDICPGPVIPRSGGSPGWPDMLSTTTRRHKSPSTSFRRAREYRARWHGHVDDILPSSFFSLLPFAPAINPFFRAFIIKTAREIFFALLRRACPITSLKFLTSLR